MNGFEDIEVSLSWLLKLCLVFVVNGREISSIFIYMEKGDTSFSNVVNMSEQSQEKWSK